MLETLLIFLIQKKSIKVVVSEKSIGVDCDFGIVNISHEFFERHNKCIYIGCGKSLEDGEFCIDPINDVVSVDSIQDTHLKLCKSGQKTGSTKGTLIGILAKFTILTAPNIPQDTSMEFSPPTLELNTLQYLMVYCSANAFADSGDSGGLCWYQLEDKIFAVGIIIERFVDRLLLVLPLEYIKAAYETHGYSVQWLLN